MHTNHYGRLFIMAALSFTSMYVLMYAMVGRFANVYSNLNQFYMAGLMTAPMVIIELVLMRGMYQSNKINIAIIVTSVVALMAFLLLIQRQVGISDRQFLKSMIPHHAAAVLMCAKAPIEDAEIKQLCKNIIAGQQSEIDQMKAKLRALEK